MQTTGTTSIIERLDVQGGSKGEIYKAADAMGRLSITNGQRWLRFSPTDAAFGKNPGQLEPVKLPPADDPEFADLLGKVIKQIKDRLNELTEEQRAAEKALSEFQAVVALAETAAHVNDLIGPAKERGDTFKSLLHRHATKELGLEFDKKSGSYAPPKDASASEPQPST